MCGVFVASKPGWTCARPVVGLGKGASAAGGLGGWDADNAPTGSELGSSGVIAAGIGGSSAPS